MIRGMACCGKRRIGECHLSKIVRKSEDIQFAKQGLNDLLLLQTKIDKCIQSNSLKEVLRFRGEYIHKYYREGVQQEDGEKSIYYDKNILNVFQLIKTCELKPHFCKIYNQSNEMIFDELMREIENTIEHYNEALSIIKKVQNHYSKDSSEYKVLTDQRVYLKFGRNRNNELIVIYFNIDHFTASNTYSTKEKIYVFSCDGESPFDKHTELELKHKDHNSILTGTEADEKSNRINGEGQRSYAHITDFQSYNKNKGQGTFLLTNLEEIIIEVNNHIIALQKKSECFIRTPIEIITGEVAPGNRYHDTLVSFYNRNGFPTIGKKFSSGKYIEDRVIYKELS